MKLYTAKEVCEILHIGRRTLANYCKDKKIKYCYIANRLLIAHDDLQEFIDSQKQKTRSQRQKETA